MASRNLSGTYTRKPLRPADYIHFYQQKKLEAVKQRLEAQNQAQPQNTQQAPNVRKRQATAAPPPRPQQQQPQQQPMDPMVTDTKNYLALKRRKQAFEDFLLVKRLEKEQSKSERKLTRLQKEFDLRQQPLQSQATPHSSQPVESIKNQ